MIKKKITIIIVIILLLIIIVGTAILCLGILQKEATNTVDNWSEYVNNMDSSSETQFTDTEYDNNEGEELIVNGTETGVYITDRVFIEETEHNAYPEKPQGKIYKIDTSLLANYADDLEHLGNTFYNNMSANVRVYIAYALDKYCRDNGLNSIFEFDENPVGNPNNNRITWLVYSGDLELYVTIDYDAMEVGIATEYIQE